MKGKSPIEGAQKRLGQTETKRIALRDIAKEQGRSYITYHGAITEFLKKTKEIRISINTMVL